MESLTWNKTDTDAVYAYMQEQERPAYMDTVRSVTAENGVPYLSFPMLESESFIEHGFSTRKKSKKHMTSRLYAMKMRLMKSWKPMLNTISAL